MCKSLSGRIWVSTYARDQAAGVRVKMQASTSFGVIPHLYRKMTGKRSLPTLKALFLFVEEGKQKGNHCGLEKR
ncbi:hypothetical protein PAJ34TS1_56880 [Paenibacillus azoreducens]|uniref:Uncharacterized protein n=1 Tax=Paenibacillus azoreducens TaxID=116718 RepID=A0A919YCP7_9BACL|nr:hypothetical protein J34TS1_20530 [Paenibacillus azoreducens]